MNSQIQECLLIATLQLLSLISPALPLAPRHSRLQSVALAKLGRTYLAKVSS